MSEAKHTPGPWYTQKSDHRRIRSSKDGEAVCWVYTTQPQRPYMQVVADARLIAAAPDLLAALRPFAAGYTGPDAPCHDGLREPAECWRCSRILAARAAIAKAEGGEG